LLCAGHHRAQRDGEFGIQRLARDRFRFRRADGRLLPDHVDPTPFSDTETPIEDDYTDIPVDAATTRWTGDRLDRHHAISVLAQHRNNRPILPADNPGRTDESRPSRARRKQSDSSCHLG
jgi:hypothetical protein